MPTSILVSLEYLMCWTCGVSYCAPTELVREKGGICCPNGHENAYQFTDDADGDTDSPKVRELRQQLVQALHRAEQAEARQADGKPPIVAGKTEDGRLKCPHCDARFRYWSGMRKHLVSKHSVEREEAERIASSAA